MSDDLASTLKWWVQHANELEADRDRWRKRALWEHAGYCTIVNHAEGTCEDYIVFCDGGDFTGAVHGE